MGEGGAGFRPARWGWALPLLAAAVVLQAWAVGYQPGTDARLYMERAGQFAAGNLTDPGTNATLAPGYSLLLAPLFVGGLRPSWPLLLALQAAVAGAAVLTLLAALVRRGVLPERGARLGALLFLANPLIWSALGSVHSEVAALALLALALAGVVVPGPWGAWGSWATAAAAALLALTRFEYLLVLPLLVGACVWLRPRGWGLRAGLTVLVTGALLAANAVRNEEIYGVATPFSLGGGSVLYAGVNAAGTGSWHTPSCEPDWYRAYLPPSFHARYAGLCAGEGDAAHLRWNALFGEMARHRWREAPGEALGAVPQKAGKLWLVPSALDLYTGDRALRRGLRLGAYFDPGLWPPRGLAKHAVLFLLHGGLLALAVTGLVRGWRSGEAAVRAWVLLSAALAATLTGVYAVVLYGLPRFHVPLLPVLVTWAALLVPPSQGPGPGLPGAAGGIGPVANPPANADL